MFFSWYPTDAFQALMADEVEEGTLEEGPSYTAWAEQMQTYQKYLNTAGEPKCFWIVLGLPGNNYSDKLEWHKEIPMVVPIKGEGKLIGIASSKEQVDALIAKDQDNVHLVFKAKIQGEDAWRKLLEFLGTHAMLEKEG